ncbi:Lsr2 family protein [Amycolatopsis minnesotensis]|uniref:Lsr2 family protein n=1 Tax=Amycolatopsis minnesotensis TaxID=337894 RepID=A0ABN2QEG0_9PSEU
MAQYLVDDLDGTAAQETILFELDGDRFRIDLSRENAAALRSVLSRYAKAGRYVRGYRRKSVREGGAAPAARQDNPVIRRWARENNLPVTDRGLIAHRILQLYEQAHPDAS